MQEMITTSINIHLTLIFITILTAIYGIYTVKKVKDSTKLINKIKYLQTQYILTVSALFFTGITVMAVNHFSIKPNLIIMIIAIIYILYSSIKLHMIRKNTNTNKSPQMEYFKEYVNKKYTTDVIIIIATALISLIFQ
jgi:hypothetical protein